ncbi:MAG: V-type ATPase 116kDa subunit family protein [Candidatus Caldatribacteriota bacterium]
MSVEKMKILGVIGKKDLLEKVLRQVILSENMHMINALSRVNSADFFLPPSEKNIEALEEEPFLKPYSEKRDFSRDEKIVNLFLKVFNIEPQLNKDFLTEEYDYDDFMRQFFNIYKQISSIVDEIDIKLREIDQKREYINNLKYLTKFDLDINNFINMKYLVFRIIRITRENYDKLKRNYENIPAVVLKVAVEGGYVVLISITPVTLEETLEKIFSSLNYSILPLPKEVNGTAQEVIEQFTRSIEEDQKRIEALKSSIEEYRIKYRDELKKLYSRLEMEKKIEELKSEIAIGGKLFFMFGFVPISYVYQLKDELEKNFKDKLIILIDDVNTTSSGITPPTKLRNFKIFKPFESLIKMYGIPAYQEKDPTIFFALTYMLLFGLMFGDVGQGFILILGGIILELIYKKTDFGGLLSRLGFSSMIFGFLFGSVFGSEEILPALLVRPMENINNLLIFSVILGVLLISSSYIFNFINTKNKKTSGEMLFESNGLAAFTFYILLLYVIFRVFIKPGTLLPILWISLLGLLLVIFFKELLISKLFPHEKEYKRISLNEYVEGGFGIIEMLLSMLSNTISFIRVGAFALNHVGLYIAFLTLSRMVNSSWGSWAILILGNIIILTLEALIVFIQALRLEYYELFTKFYRGNGIEYVPIRINGRLFQEGKKILKNKGDRISVIRKIFSFFRSKEGGLGLYVYSLIYGYADSRANCSHRFLSCP